MVRELTETETHLATRALRELRPRWTSDADVVDFIDQVLRPQGYRLAATFEDTTDQAVAVAGFRINHSLSFGKYLYVDDLSTVASARRRGHGTTLLNWLATEARRLECDQIHLDSGVGHARAAAHRVYLNSGFEITAFHFAAPLERRGP